MLEGNEAAKGQRVAADLATVLGVAATLSPAFSLKGEGEDGGFGLVAWSCGSTRNSERLRPGSPRTGVGEPGDAWRVPGCSQPGPRDGGAADLGDSGAGGGQVFGAEAADPFAVVAAADEEHALPDALGGFFAITTGHPGERTGVFGGLDDLCVGGFGVGAGDVRFQLHGAAHVGGADPAAVDGGFGEDGFAVGDGLGGFDLDHHEDLVVGPLHVVGPVALGVGGAQGPYAAGRVTDGFAGAAGVFSGVDHGDDDAEHAGIKGLADLGDVVAGDAGEGHGAAGDDGDESVLEQGPVPDPVLLFEHDPVVAETGADFS